MVRSFDIKDLTRGWIFTGPDTTNGRRGHLLLGNVSRSASFDPYSVLMEFGFSLAPSQNPLAPLSAGVITSMEASNALHEFTHQDGMFSEMGQWYLHTFWKYVAELYKKPSGILIAGRSFLWEAYWLTAFLLEGQAMFAQLHLVPGTGEASTRQYGFMRRLGMSYNRIVRNDLGLISSGIQRLFSKACDAAHREGLQFLLLDGSVDTEHYRLGYLFFRGAQRYLSQFDKRLLDPETFFIFFCTFLFENAFEHFTTNNIFEQPASAVFWHIMESIRKFASALPEVLEPVSSFPKHQINYALVDYIRFMSNGQWTTRRRANEGLSHRADDIARVDKKVASLFMSSVASLQFFHLKVSDVLILSLSDEASPMLTMVHFEGGKQGAVSLRIRSETASKIRALAISEGKRLLNLGMLEILSPKTQYEAHEFIECEFSTICPVGHGFEFSCLSTERWFIFVDALTPMVDARDDTGLLAERGIPSHLLDVLNRDRGTAHERLMGILENDSFTRSRRFRKTVVDEYLGRLKETEEHFEKHMTSTSRDSAPLISCNPAAVCEEARLAVKDLFQMAILPSAEQRIAVLNPITEAVRGNHLEDRFRTFCFRPPLDANGRYQSKKAGPELTRALAHLFQHSFLTSQTDGDIGDVGEFL